jgi:hypothetical protein
VLKSEQDHAMKEHESGNTMLVPSGLVTEPEFSDAAPMGAAEYGEYLGDRIERIQQACGLGGTQSPPRTNGGVCKNIRRHPCDG